MAMKITRTVQFTRISCVQVCIDNGVPVMMPGKDLILFQRIPTRDKATDVLRKAYGPDFTVVAFTEESSRYEMPLEDFIKYSTKIEDVPLPEGNELLSEELNEEEFPDDTTVVETPEGEDIPPRQGNAPMMAQMPAPSAPQPWVLPQQEPTPEGEGCQAENPFEVNSSFEECGWMPQDEELGTVPFEPTESI